MLSGRSHQEGGLLDTDKVIAALEGLTRESPRGQESLRKEDHQLYCDFMVGETTFVKEYPFAITGKQKVFPADEILYSIADWQKAQSENK